MKTVETRNHCYPSETKYKASWSLWVFFHSLLVFAIHLQCVCVPHTTQLVSANRLTPFAKSILEHIHLFESPRIPLSYQKNFYSIILETTRNTFDSFHLHSEIRVLPRLKLLAYWYFCSHYVDSMARNIINRDLTNRRLQLEDAVGFSDMSTAHAREGTYPATSRQIGRR